MLLPHPFALWPQLIGTCFLRFTRTAGTGIRFFALAIIAGCRILAAVCGFTFGILGTGLFLILEISFIPARTFQPETACRNHLFQSRLTAYWTIRQGRFTDFLYFFNLIPAGLTSVFINRHSIHPCSRLQKKSRIVTHLTFVWHACFSSKFSHAVNLNSAGRSKYKSEITKSW